MAGPIVFVAIQVFLFGITNAACPEKCQDTKIFPPGAICDGVDCEGTWHLKNRESANCIQPWNGKDERVCKYRRDSDGLYMCFCDPGIPGTSCIYEEGQDWVGGLCYNNDPVWGTLNGTFPVKNSYAYCMNQCKTATPPSPILAYTYFGLADGDKCYCGNTEPVFPVNPANCNLNCPGDPLEKCGGTNTINIWAIPKLI